ncbi:phage holin family protein [Archangium lansingense]|uniref:Phage holin family protein n=1 Tax=Archangium lansingense TaxID=2995310 RepID=A0ABT4A3E6_9BACT|nr:phage holin family protein [Archangium lansinium]MCY1075504.1 phage holin family protein [Archangium lansinium]
MQPGNPDTRRGFDYEERTVPGDGMSGRDLGSLLGEFFEQGKRLIRAEIALAKTELRQEVTKVKAGGVMVGVGGLLLFIGALTFAAFACVLLDLVMPLWAATLIVTVAFLAIGAGLAMAGIKRIKEIHPPNQTIQTLKEDSQWASRTFQSVKSQMHGHA